ncbi:MAG: hypothetical protein LBU62_09720 [Bacteroidales bacterium]|nr:hypothetical protein [Bacteroidales bacterium]
MGETPQNLNSMLNAQDIKTGVVERIASAIKKPLYFFFPEKVELDDANGITSPTPIYNVEKPKKLIPFYDDMVTFGGVTEYAANMEGSATTEVIEIDAGDWFKEATCAIRHYGDSMIEYPRGCILALKEIHNLDLIIWGKDYVIETDEMRITKRLQKGPNPDSFWAYSTNPETYTDGRLIHEPVDIPKSQIKRLSLVLGYVVKNSSSGIVYVNTKK